MSEPDRPVITITISDVPDQYKNVLALTISDFLEFSGFVAEIITAHDPSDEDLEYLMERYTDILHDMNNNIRVKVVEE
jgi:hypothetical protein